MMKVLAKELKIGMEVKTSPGHCLVIQNIEFDVIKKTGKSKVVVSGVTRNFNDRNSEYWTKSINTINMKGDTMVQTSFPNKPQ